MFFKIGALKNFAIFHGETSVLESLFIVAGLKPATILKEDSNTGVFLWNIAKFLRTPFPTEHL